jgi:hypothetical protein
MSSPPPEVTSSAPITKRSRLVVALILIVLTSLSGAVVGAFVGALAAGQLLVDNLKQHGKLTDLLWIGAGAAIGAGLVWLWANFRKGKATESSGQDDRHGRQLRLWLGGTIGAVLGAAVVAPTGVAAVVLPPAAACAVLFPFGFGIPVLVLIFLGVGRAPLLPMLLGGAFCGLLQGWTLWLVFSALASVDQAPQADLGRAFSDMFSQMAAGAVGIPALVFAVSGGVCGLLLFWRLHAMRHAGESSPAKE